jgi:hypothetical protein
VAFTAGSLITTALTLRTGQEELRNAQQGQITDRYTQAIEQLSSGKPEVRLGGIYALERLMTDSMRDRRTILEVLSSYVRVHAQDPPPVGSDKTRLAVDAEAALTVVSRHDGTTRENDTFHLDLANVDFHGKNLSFARLEFASLRDADLRGADLRGAHLRDADMAVVILRDADLTFADLRDAGLTAANLHSVNLTLADLRRVSLVGADLRDANLRGADLRDVDLRGADLRGVRGMTADTVKRVAKTDVLTRF